MTGQKLDEVFSDSHGLFLRSDLKGKESGIKSFVGEVTVEDFVSWSLDFEEETQNYYKSKQRLRIFIKTARKKFFQQVYGILVFFEYPLSSESFLIKFLFYSLGKFRGAAATSSSLNVQRKHSSFVPIAPT